MATTDPPMQADTMPPFHYTPHLFKERWNWEDPHTPRTVSTYLCSNLEPVTFVVPSIVRAVSLDGGPRGDKCSVAIDFEPTNYADAVALERMIAASAQPAKGAVLIVACVTFSDISAAYDVENTYLLGATRNMQVRHSIHDAFEVSFVRLISPHRLLG